ncbi:sugar ABC transporter permease [Mesorhizobium loti]|nr:sugar ABC transporter permease [Mesorhizobium loti]
MARQATQSEKSWMTKPAFYALLGPALVLLLSTTYPFLSGIYTSLTNQKLYTPATKFVGLGNYINLLETPLFWTGLANTLTYAAAALAIQLPLGLAFAILLDVPGRLQSFFRSTIVLPLLVPPVVAGLIWKTMMHPQSGVLNWLLAQVGIEPLSWLTSPHMAMASIILIDTWLFTPLATIILLAGLQSVSGEIVEAARIDGANAWQVIRHVKLPLLAPYLLLVALFRVSDSLKSLEIIYSTTKGGPLDATRTLHVMAYEEAYRWSSLGKAMTIVFVLWLVCYAISGVLLSFWQKQEAKSHGQ